MELHGQQLAKQAFGGELGRLALDSIPAHHHTQFVKDFGNPDREGEYDLLLRRLYRSLRFSDRSSLSEKATIGDRLSRLLELRNKSLLAHGIKPFPNKKFTKFRDAALEAFGFTMSDIPRWPRLNLKLKQLYQ